MPDIIIAVDGYSATGKSSVAKLVAKQFGFLYLDSGALYRGVTLYALENGLIDPEKGIDEAALRQALGQLDLTFRAGDGGGTYLGERRIEEDIRTLEVSSWVSPVSAIPFVRKYVDERLHALASHGRVIMDGRDIGTTVFPNADIKVFKVASDEIRAKRRYNELVAKGETPTMEAVLKNLKERDYIDSHRETSPLRRAEDAFVMDDTDMTVHEEVVWFEGLIRGKYGILE
ncbi:MAG: (d)CMP kinase [Bacteroidales bacterium]|nr:(d)CMP kinase [Bacteroidales bacterium]